MRTKILTLLILIIVSFVTCYAEKNYRVISPTNLNIRKSASISSEILGTLQSGQEIEVKSVNNGWAKVKFEGKNGYVLSEYITPIQGAYSPEFSANSANVIPESKQEEPKYDSDYDDAFEQERKVGTFELSYCASSFEDVKLTGSYGLSWTSLLWKLAPRLYAGYHFSPFNLNYGLVDSSLASDKIKLGPAIGYYFTPKIFVAMPLDVICDVYFDSDDNTKTEWGMSLAPTVYVGGKGGVFIGPQFTIGFFEGSEVSCGFRAGLYF